MTGRTKSFTEYDILHENKDYLLVEDAIKVLRNQLTQAEKDISILKEYKEKALNDPISFVENLINKKYNNLPRLQKVFSIPNINLSKYQPHSLRKDTKYSNSNSNINGIFKDIAYIEDTSVPNSPVVNTPKRKRSVEEAEDKSSFYTKEWTDEEIDQLWNLLEIFPEESTPMARYIKISSYLGTKSPKQVENKVQTLSKKRKSSRKNLKPQKIAAESKIKAEKTLYSNRFSGAAYLGTPTVYMSDEEENEAAILGTGTVSINSAAATETVDSLAAPSTTTSSRSRNRKMQIPDDDTSDEDYEEPVSKPKRIHSNSSISHTRTTNNSLSSAYMTRSSSYPLNDFSLHKPNEEKKKKSNHSTKPDFTNNIHYGIQCDRCGIEPIVGIRYKCKVCKDPNQIDLCEDCISKGFENELHKSNHEFETIEKYIPEDDRTIVSSEDYSYLGFSRQL